MGSYLEQYVMPETAEERRRRLRRAALIRWAHETDTTRTARAGQAGLLRRFEKQVDPEGVLPEDERRIRAERLRRVHMAEIRKKRGKTVQPTSGNDVDAA